MDTYTQEYEKLKQKIHIKELNGMDTLDEQTKELILILDEFIKTTSPRDVKSLIEETEKEELKRKGGWSEHKDPRFADEKAGFDALLVAFEEVNG